MKRIILSFLAWSLLTHYLVTSHDSSPGRRASFGPELNHRKYEAPSIIHYGTFSGFSTADSREIAKNFVSTRLHPNADFIIKDIYKSEHNGVTHVYFKQVFNGLIVTNADLNVNIDRFGRIISYGDSFVVPRPKPREGISNQGNDDDDNFIGGQFRSQFTLGSEDGDNPILLPGKHVTREELYYHVNDEVGEIISPERALEYFARFVNKEMTHPEKFEYTEYSSLDGNDQALLISNVPFALSDVRMSQSYIQMDDQSLSLTWDIQIEMEDNWYNAHLNAYTGDVISLVDWVADAAYNVFPLGINDPSDGDRKLLEDPYDLVASPYGWHTQGKKNFTNTIGNNVYAHENLKGRRDWEDNYRPEGGDLLTFDFPLDLNQAPNTYIDASVTNLFYWNNIIHDLFYRYGFNEIAGNFQKNNYGKGGKGGDPVIANAQDGSGFNNANFATPPDGQNGKMRMYVWDISDPWRDGDLESGIIIHEYSHGISTRLTGGPANSNCLGWGEAGGMGEGWGDFFATILRMNSTIDRTRDFGMGDWANGGEGIRKYMTNPETFSYLDKPGYWGVHAKGAVWAELLYEVYWNLVDKHGFTPDWFPPTDNHPTSLAKWYSRKSLNKKIRTPKHGNTLTLQLVVDGLKLQPCRPTFIDARDAIIQADELLTGGENACEIWRGFAKRGLGLKAKIVGGTPWGGGIRKESNTIPERLYRDLLIEIASFLERTQH
ncbi:7341_t:CDS:2 [Acaulospora colombiana]|uniref:7341_t:CDS:1 n=1 Tax=Acaulospora colombiana TaxID=27376 RepID=A0ACA9LEM2_9GLOM|nr:7341_t:CDS:2 [Acaulospora colombiana]